MRKFNISSVIVLYEAGVERDVYVLINTSPRAPVKVPFGKGNPYASPFEGIVGLKFM
jgi:hypothetical protein